MRVAVSALPVIDLAPWFEGTAPGRAQVAREVDRACSSLGFFQVVGHGIPAATIEAMRRETDAFFALPLAEKLRHLPPRAGLNRGYAALGSEALAYSLGAAPARPDLFEAFNVGPDVVPDDPWHQAAPHDFFAPNLWPEGMPALRAAVSRYFDEAHRVAQALADVFAPALGLPDGWFRPYTDRSTLTLRLLDYERRPGDPDPEPGQMRMGAHTDYGMLTVLWADAVPGLELLAPDGRWRGVLPDPGALLVNLGDLTAQWTNDRWRSTLHRVVPPPAGAGAAARRRSAAFFFDANYDARVACVPTQTGPGRPPKYPPVIAGEHLIAKILGPRTLAPSRALSTASDRWRAP